MDDLWRLTRGRNAAALVFAFLDAGCGDSDYNQELLRLGQDLHLVQDKKSPGSGIECPDDGDLETDGHMPRGDPLCLDDLQPSVDQWPGGPMDAAALRQVAEGLREIGAQLEHDIAARGIQNLYSRISVSPSEQWKHHLALEVERAVRQGVGLDHLPKERVLVALTLTLVRGVCVRAPRLLRSLFATALQLLGPAR